MPDPYPEKFPLGKAETELNARIQARMESLKKKVDEETHRECHETIGKLLTMISKHVPEAEMSPEEFTLFKRLREAFSG